MLSTETEIRARARLEMARRKLLSSVEELLTSPQGFGLPARPVQRAACRVRDGRPLEELRDDPDVVDAFGGEGAIEALPSERGIKPLEFCNVAAARTAKTMLAVGSAVVDSQKLDLSMLRVGEIPRISVVSLKLDVANVPFDMLKLLFTTRPLLKPLLLRPPVGHSIFVRHPSGREVEIAIVFGGRAAGGLVARWSGGLIADEAPRMLGRDEAVANLDDMLSAVRERLLPGAQIQYIGSPWAPSGPVFEAVEEHFGRPTERLVVMRSKGPAANPSYWTDELIEDLRQNDEVAWRINALGEFIDPESGLVTPQLVRARSRNAPHEVPYRNSSRYAAAVDPSGGGAGANAFTLVIVEEPGPDEHPEGLSGSFYRVALARQWRGERPEAIWSQVAEVCRRYRLLTATTDQFAADANRDLALRYDLDLNVQTSTQASKVEDFTNMASLLSTEQLELPPNRVLQQDLMAVKKKATQTGFTIVLPKGADGRHCDFAPALASALRAARFRWEYQVGEGDPKDERETAAQRFF